MESQSTNTRISQSPLTPAPSLSDRASAAQNPQNTPRLIELRKTRWHRQVLIIGALLLALNPAWAEGGQAKNALGAPPAETAAKAGGGSVGVNNPSSTAILQVRINRNELQTEVHVDGNGPLSYVTFRLSDPDRLVLDFSDTLVHMARKSIPGDMQAVRAVRVGQFKADVARVVIDLASEVPYTIREAGNVVTVVFDSAAEADPGAASKRQTPVVENAVLAKFPLRSLPDVKPSDFLSDSLTQPAAQDSPSAARAGPSRLVSPEGRPGGAQPTQQAPSAPVAKQASSVAKADSAETAALPLPDDMRRADAAESTTKPAETLAAPGAARAKPSTPASAEPHLVGDQPTQPAAPAPTSEEKSEPTSEPISAFPDEDYTIGVDDLLAIHVWKEPEISRVVSVRPDGKISLPLIGELKASGLTPRVLQKTVATRLRSYLFEPEVAVIVQEIRSLRFNIVGEVNRPGTYPLVKPMTVLDAIALAGGFRDFAKITKIYVLRLRANGSRMRSPFNYKDVIKGHDIYQNVELEPHDTIVVP
ncbi:MAG TPA: polysaccharide biosynthesis/export family protein [Terriglobales bacterium]|nr:polysaccharide biosynthesis/export family protein [Terriglobales bacterium]